MTSAKQRLHERVAAILMIATLAVWSPSSGRAQTKGDGEPREETGSAARQMNLGVGKSMIVELPRDAAEVFVADPKVANAVVRSARKLYIIAVGGGQTSIYAMDAQGRRITTMEISVGRDIGELGRILKAAMPSAQVVPRTINDTIILTGTVDSAGEAQMAVDIAKGFAADFKGGMGKDGKVVNSLVVRGRDMVMLKVTIAEVQREVIKQLGITQGALRGGWGVAAMQNPLTQNLTNGSTTIGNLAGIISGASNGIAADIKAFERNSVARILAEPTVTAVSGENAKFTAGGEIPVPTSESCSTQNGCVVAYSYKPIGVTLNFTPVVLAEGRILLRIATEVTELDPTTSVVLSRISLPGFRTRKNETSVELPSGGSIASAGLIQTISRQAINGLPGLMNLPILGTLFRSREYQRLETELVIIVTPYIAKSSKPSEIARPSDGFSDATDPQSVFLGRVNRIYSTAENPQLLQNFKGRLGFIAD